jgi:ABC-type molybdenum transport system ATPase subunit/photorepair protein PhrA
MKKEQPVVKEKPMLTSIEVRGFKRVLDPMKLELSRVNFILGPNNSGKTSFFQAYELANWVQRNGSVAGLHQADVFKALNLRSGSLNSDFPKMKSLDFSVQAVTKTGDFIEEARYVGNEHEAKQWAFELDGFTLQLWPNKDGSMKWVAQPVGQRTEPWQEAFHAKALREKVAEEVISGLKAFEFDVVPSAMLMLTEVSGAGEIVDLNAANAPASFRGCIARKGEVEVVLDGDGQFSLADREGRIGEGGKWDTVLGLELESITKLEFSRLYWLHRALLRHQALFANLVSGRIHQDTSQNFSDSLRDVGGQWIRENRVLFNGEEGGWDFTRTFIEAWQNIDWHLDGEVNLLLWLSQSFPVHYSLFNQSSHGLFDEDGMRMSFLSPRYDLFVNEEGKLDATRLLPGVDEKALMPYPRIAEDDVPDGDMWGYDGAEMLDEWCEGVEGDGDLKNFIGLLSSSVSWGISWDGERWKATWWGRQNPRFDDSPKAQFEVPWEDGRGFVWEACKWNCTDFQRAEFIGHMRHVASNPKELQEKYGKPSRLNRVPKRRWTEYGFEPDTVFWTEGQVHWHLGIIQKIAQLSGAGMLFDFSVSKDDSMALSAFWSAAEKHIKNPFSFHLFRVSPDAQPLRDRYDRPEDFPFPELWSVLQNKTNSQSRFKQVREGVRVVQACVQFLGISDRFQLNWKPLNRRLEISLSASRPMVEDQGIHEIYASYKALSGREVLGDLNIKVDSIWGAMDKDLDYDSASRIVKDVERGQVEDLGRGSRLVLKCLMSMIEASIRNENCLVVLEEPSAFLHPMMAAKFSEVLRFAADKLDVQVIVETHNEYMVRQLVTNRLEGEALDDVTIHYFRGSEKEAKKGTTEITRLEIDEGGRFNPPIPEGFLDKSQEMMREQTRIQLDKELGLDS